MSRKRNKPKTNRSVSSLIEEALTRYRQFLSSDEYNHLLEELERPLFPAIRLNPLKVDPTETLPLLVDDYGWELRPVPYCDTGCWITKSRTSISNTVEHRMGIYYIQDAASMLPVELFDLERVSDPLILDLAASPGGKTTHLISRTGDQGLVIANDASRDRITALRHVLRNWGAVNVAVTRFPGEKFGTWYPETFDCVLLDAPCSMINLRSTESHPMRPISEREQQTLVRRQKRLLASAFQAAKVGGQVVYSTCTLAPEENEAVLDALLGMYPDAVQVEDVSSHLAVPAPALGSDGITSYHPSIQRAARLWPHQYGTSGFFAALLTKTASVSTLVNSPPSRQLKRNRLELLDRRRKETLADSWLVLYGIDLNTILEKQNLTLWVRGGSIIAIPDAFISRFKTLPFQMAGLVLGKVVPGGVIPSHEWVSRFDRQFVNGRYQLIVNQVSSWLRGENIPGKPKKEHPLGMVILVEDQHGRFLGRGKILASQIKNLFPRRLIQY